MYDNCLEVTYTEPDEDKVFKAIQDQLKGEFNKRTKCSTGGDCKKQSDELNEFVEDP